MYKVARLLKDIVWTFIEESPGNTTERESIYENLTESEKNYWKWKSKVLLRFFNPYYYDGKGDLVIFYLYQNEVLKEWLDCEYEAIRTEFLSLEEFLENELYFLNLEYPTTKNLIEALEEEVKKSDEMLQL